GSLRGVLIPSNHNIGSLSPVAECFSSRDRSEQGSVYDPWPRPPHKPRPTPFPPRTAVTRRAQRSLEPHERRRQCRSSTPSCIISICSGRYRGNGHGAKGTCHRFRREKCGAYYPATLETAPIAGGVTPAMPAGTKPRASGRSAAEDRNPRVETALP